MPNPKGTAARLVITCLDRPGIVAAVSRFLHSRGANIIHSDQHSTDPKGGKFFMRLEFYCQGLNDFWSELENDFKREVGDPFEMRWRMQPEWKPLKTAILVSKFDHALMDLLWRWKRNELDMDLTMVISNHDDLRKEVEAFGVPFVHIPVEKGKKEEAEKEMMDLMEGKADLVILARYMQILSPVFLEKYHGKVINIHHSFLPAFVGADPYRRAAERGVKLIGATAHYVTEELDQGPIIEQDVIRVTHREDVEELKVLGRDIERQVLARAVKWHLADRVLVDGNKTIVFT
ncbi:MAG: formyltetrahydrofolate deformylase [Desulfovibrio sp.]